MSAHRISKVLTGPVPRIHPERNWGGTRQVHAPDGLVEDTIPESQLTIEDKKYDQKMVKKSGIPIKNIDILFDFYALKGCYYLQMEEKGFYYLKEDVAKLCVPQFQAEKFSLRLRAKTHHSYPVYKYSFFVVINVSRSSIRNSPYDLEEKVGMFPPITE